MNMSFGFQIEMPGRTDQIAILIGSNRGSNREKKINLIFQHIYMLHRIF
jgi:hypothetical protein